MFLPLGDDVDNRTIPLVGTFLLIVNSLVYAYEVRLYYDSVEAKNPAILDKFVRHWGLVPAELEEDEYLGVVTHMFLHGSFMHLLGNMIVLWAFVRTLENMFGSASFLGMYLIWGIASGLLQSMFQEDKTLPLIGASGAISGMVGAYLVAFGLRTKIKTLMWLFGVPRRVDVPAELYIGIWLMTQLMGLAGETEGDATNIAWYAHIGGFSAGALTMLLVRKQTARKLVLTRDGDLQFVEGAEPAGVGQATAPIAVPQPVPKAIVKAARKTATQPAAQLAGRVVSAPEACPHCATPVHQGHLLAAGLLQCPNSDCRRLTYFG